MQARSGGGLFGFVSARSSVSRVLRVLGRPAVRVGVLARRLFGVRVARDVRNSRRPNLYKSQHAAMANFVPADARSGEGTARPGGAVARSSRVIAAGEATAQAIGPVPVAHPAVWTPGLKGLDCADRIGRPCSALAPWPRPLRNSPPHREFVTCDMCGALSAGEKRGQAGGGARGAGERASVTQGR